MTGLELATLAVAVVGAVTGIAGTLLSVMNYRRDRPVVRVRVERGHLGSPGEGWDGPYIFVRAVNAGRRAVRLQSGGLLLPKPHDRLQIMPGPPGHMTALPATINEAQEQQLWTRIDGFAPQLAKKDGALPTHGYFDDSTGRRWKGPVPKDIKEELLEALHQFEASAG